MARFLNDGTQSPPALKVYLNLDNLADKPVGARWPDVVDPDFCARLVADGFDGVQWTGRDAPPAHFWLPFCGLDRIDEPTAAAGIVAWHKERGDVCLTLHAGWGIESDSEVDALVTAILAAGRQYEMPVFIETHRATITQDMWRTVEITKRFPAVVFNGDFSHYYCGQEMVYGGLNRKLQFMQPILDRIGFMHGRVASPGWMQAPVPDGDQRPDEATGEIDYWADFRTIWRLAIRGFLNHAGPGDILVFAPELLSGRYYYARNFQAADGSLREESDRYQQAQRYAAVARRLFAGESQQPLTSPPTVC
jgi:hypothetical protein